MANLTLVTLGKLFFSQGYGHPLAYLDPGTGSYLLQLLVAGLLGGLFLLKTYWGRITTFAKGIFSKSNDEDAPGEQEADVDGQA